MSELEWAVFFGNVIWFGSLISPVAAGLITVLIARREDVDRVRAGLLGTLSTFALGAAGSFLLGERIISATMGSGDVPYYLVAQAWHRMWYPLGISLIIGTALALYSLLAKD
jgi:hypothetical protein